MGKDPDVSSEGRLWAVLSYASFFVGFPLGVVPLVMRNDAFALYHAKHSVAVFLAFFVSYLAGFVLAIVLFFLTCGMGNFITVPLLMLMMVWPFTVAIHGLVLAANGEMREPLGAFGLGEKIFGSIQVIEQRCDALDQTDETEELPNPSKE